MGGLVIDIYIEYLYRAVTRMIKRRGSSAWPIASATVTSRSCSRADYGCDVAEIYYTYRVDGELYTDVNEKPFIIHNSGENYVSGFAPGREFVVRVNPKDSAIPLVRDDDQA